ncbi:MULTISPECIES: hypothetical protein [unclassified Mycolicibacterium]|uniref:hypothetical protein n=1 Tax=unclassified Mycolicibacterium TaxID=2636767 RepID=UPI002EDB8B50
MHTFERRFVAAVSACVATAMIAGCGSSAAPTAQKSAPTEQSTEATTSAKPQKASYARWPNGNVHRNLATIFSGCAGDATYERKLDPDAEIFQTSSGQYVHLPQPTVAPGDELLDYACTVANTKDGGQRAIHYVYTRTPSHGLTPESKQAKLYSFDLAKPNAPVVKDFPLDPEQRWNFRPGMDAFSVSQNGSHVVFFDANTLEVRTQLDVQPFAQQSIAGINYDGYALDDKNTFHLIRSDGSEAGSVPDVNDYITTPRGFLLDVGPNRDVHYFDMTKGALSDVVAPYLMVNSFLHSRDQANYHDNPDYMSQDIYGDNMLLTGSDTKKGDFITVINLAEGKPVFTLGQDKLAGLNIEGSHIAGKYLYLQNNSDSPVVDFTTGQVAHNGWSQVPLIQLADGWAIVLPAEPGQQNPIPDGWEASHAHLARAEDGAAYAGPWF